MLVSTLLIDGPNYSSTFYVDATWYPENGHVRITYNDVTSSTEHVTLEVLGLANTFHVEHTSSNFTENVDFEAIPNNGWRAHPIVFDIVHAELGNISIKTEVHSADQPAPSIIYGSSN